GADRQAVRVELVRRFSPHPFNLGAAYLWEHRAHHVLGYLILQLKQITNMTIVGVSPNVRGRHCIDHAKHDARAVAGLSDASDKQIANAALSSQPPRIERLPGMKMLWDHDRKRANAAKCGGDSLRQILRKKSMLRSKGDDIAWQDRERWPIG